MKLRELLSLGKLPRLYRQRVLLYSWRKLFGRVRTEEQTEANRLLRFLASAESQVVDADPTHIRLQVRLFERTLQVEARCYPSSDLGILYQVLGKQEYAPVVELVKKLALSQKALRVVDAGANVGYASLYFKSAFPNAEVVALEIDPANAHQLRRQLVSNQFNDVRVLENALWSTNANLRIRRDFRDQTECSFYVEETTGAAEVTGYSLRTICEQMQWTGVDVLKIDVEGGERYLFQTDALANELLQTTRILAIEIHDEFEIRPTIEYHLKRHGFTFFEHGDLTIAYREKPGGA